MKTLIEAILKGLLEFARIATIAFFSFMLTEGIIDFLIEYFLGSKIDVSAKLLITAGLTSAIKSADRAIHEVSSKDGFFGVRGLVGF